MLRRFVKTAVVSTLHRTRADQLIRLVAGSKNMPLVLCYHRVVEDFGASAGISSQPMLISRQMLSRHLDWIGSRYRFISLDDLGSRLESGRKFDQPVAAITFDDGYGDAYNNAFPLLKRKGIPAAFFVATDVIGTSRVHVHDRLYLSLARAFSRWRSAPRDLAGLLAGLRIGLPDIGRMSNAARTPVVAVQILFEALPQAVVQRVIEALEAEVGIDGSALNELRPLSWEMLSEMYLAGMTIGSHTKTHPVLTNESRERVLDETVGARQKLERRLGIAPKHFAYPAGKFNVATTNAVAASGYQFAYIACSHRDPNYPLLTIPRTLLWEHSCADASGRFSAAMMSYCVHSIFNFVTRCRDNHIGEA